MEGYSRRRLCIRRVFICDAVCYQLPVINSAGARHLDILYGDAVRIHTPHMKQHAPP